MTPHGFIAPGEPLILVEELTHRVIGEFTHAILSIDEAAARASSSEAKEALSAAVDILRAYVAAHRALQAPHAPGQMKLGAYLAGLCDAQSSARLRERGVRLTLKPCDVSLGAARCWRIGLIVAELINNAVRHGFSGGGTGDIDIELLVEDASVVCRVTDNGRAAIDAPPARGRFLVEALACELGGDVTWDFSATGTTVLLTAPIDVTPGGEIPVAAEARVRGIRSTAKAAANA
jgi:two-component sensor histidine kinase